MNLREEGFWDDLYSSELKNYEQNNDAGDIWFGKGLNRRIINWISNYVEQSSTKVTEVKNLIDIGCGNASLLIDIDLKLNENLCRMKLCGIDYSLNAIKLGQKKLIDLKLNDRVRLSHCDFLSNQELISKNLNYFDLIVDVGTFDAICLIDNSPSRITAYVDSISSLYEKSAIFVLASCNHTKAELNDLLLTKNNLNAQMVDEIESPSLMFGGSTGSQVTCLILRLNKDGPTRHSE